MASEVEGSLTREIPANKGILRLALASLDLAQNDTRKVLSVIAAQNTRAKRVNFIPYN